MTVNNAHISEQFLQDVLRGEKLADVTLLIFRDPKRFTAGDLHRAVRRSSGIFCRSRSWKTPAKTPADKIMKNYFIFQQTFGIKWEN